MYGLPTRTTDTNKMPKRKLVLQHGPSKKLLKIMFLFYYSAMSCDFPGEFCFFNKRNHSLLSSTYWNLKSCISESVGSLCQITSHLTSRWTPPPVCPAACIEPKRLEGRGIPWWARWALLVVEHVEKKHVVLCCFISRFKLVDTSSIHGSSHKLHFLRVMTHTLRA